MMTDKPNPTTQGKTPQQTPSKPPKRFGFMDIVIILIVLLALFMVFILGRQMFKWW